MIAVVFKEGKLDRNCLAFSFYILAYSSAEKMVAP